MNILPQTVGVSSGLFLSIYFAIFKSLLKHQISEPFLFFLYICIIQVAIATLLLLFVKPAFPLVTGWASLLLAGKKGVIAFLFLYMSLSSGDASSVMPITGSKVIFVGFLVTFMLNEKHTWTV